MSSQPIAPWQQITRCRIVVRTPETLLIQLWRRIRGLLGTALTWGAVGALVGALMFTVRYQPWSLPPERWERATTLLGMFLGAGGLWGAACGLAFGVVLLVAARRQRFDQLSAGRFMLWGAVAGAAFPLVIYTPIVLTRGGLGAIPLYSTLTAISALLGAGFGRIVFAIAKRAPSADRQPAALSDTSLSSKSEVPLATGERVR